ncbi:unnamed protein product [Schistocephalus solidus]|uniref:Universal stress protein MJ0577 n=1 Tax=Schistocephalus solidus TaxID=70667 RepID=A0A0X3PM85_SCHSO|nr:unnamed protein product [Schistocephalus solidus]
MATSQMEEGVKRLILLPIDDSLNCEYAWKWYVRYEMQKGDSVIFMHVLKPKITASAERRGSLTLDVPISFDKDVAEAMDACATTAKNLAKEFTDRANEVGLPNKVLLESGSSAGAVIVKAAHDHAVQLVVMGSRGVGSVQRTFLGSVSDYVVHHIGVPVVVVPPAESKSRH